MTAIKHTLLISLLVAATCVSTSLAIKCYVCQSNVDPKCADPFDNLTLPITDCDSYPRADLVPKSEYELSVDNSFFGSFGQPSIKPVQATMCRKIRQKVKGEWRTIRGCGYLGPPGKTDSAGKSSGPDQSKTSANINTDDDGTQCIMRHGAYDVFMESCSCNNKDGCNGTIKGSDVNNWLLILAISLLLIINNVSRHANISFSQHV